jgi:hypothetical protein
LLQENIKTNGDFCFNQIIALPQKGGTNKPLFNYEQIIFDALAAHDGNSNKHLWIKKAASLGVSEFILLFVAWLCLKDNSLVGSQLCIVTGPSVELAIVLIYRMKILFPFITFDTKETVIELIRVKKEAFPSHHLDAMRGSPHYSAANHFVC